MTPVQLKKLIIILRSLHSFSHFVPRRSELHAKL